MSRCTYGKYRILQYFSKNEVHQIHLQNIIQLPKAPHTWNHYSFGFFSHDIICVLEAAENAFIIISYFIILSSTGKGEGWIPYSQVLIISTENATADATALKNTYGLRCGISNITSNTNISDKIR